MTNSYFFRSLHRSLVNSLVGILFIYLVALTACTTKSKAKMQAQQAFLNGQQQAITQTQQPGTNVVVIGEVRKPVVEWSEGLSLSQAIVAAEYQGHRDPLEILILRRGQYIRVEPRRLLLGYDELLEPGDRVELRR